MKKKYILLLCLNVLLSFLLPLSVVAHSGRTDSFDGHYDGSNYHYHHGYSAHDHYDMDGDGDIDCPYNFDDKTGIYSGTSSSVDRESNNTPDNQSPVTSISDLSVLGVVKSLLISLLVLLALFLVIDIAYCAIFLPLHALAERLVKRNQKINIWVVDCVIHVLLSIAVSVLLGILVIQRISLSANLIMALFIIAGLSIVTLALLNHAKSNELDKKDSKIYQLNRNLSKTENELQTALKCNKDIDESQATLSSLHRQLSQTQTRLQEINRQIHKAELIRYRVQNAPLDVTFTKNGEPILGIPDDLRPYGDYTVFLSVRPMVYHTNHKCAPSSALPSHIFHVMKYARPCRKCAKSTFHFSEAPDWYSPK